MSRRTSLVAFAAVALAASTASADLIGKLDPKKTGTDRRMVMRPGFLEGQIELAKDKDLVEPLKEALAAVDATLGKAGGCFPNRRYAIRFIASGARAAWKVPLVAGLQPVLDALKAAKPGKEGHAPIVAALEEAMKTLKGAGGAFRSGLRRAIKYLRDKDCDLWFGRRGAQAPPDDTAEKVPAPTVEFPKLDPKKTGTDRRMVMRPGFIEGQIELAKDKDVVGPLKEALAAVDATVGKAGGCFPNRRYAIRYIAMAARSAWRVPLLEGLTPVLDALKAAKPGKEGHAPIVEALEGAMDSLKKAGGAFRNWLRKAVKYLRDKDCDLALPR